MSLAVNTKTYNADAIREGAVGYIGPANTLSVKDQVKLARSAPAPTADFSGVSRTSAKLTRTLTLTGAKTTAHDLILEVSVSVPVGAVSADIDSALNDMGSFLASATFKTHVKTPQINF